MLSLWNSLLYHPLINALVAAVYIVAVASVMYYAPKVIGKVETVLVPVAMISLFTLSAAVMGYLFLYQPLQLYLAGEKRNATRLFLQTVLTFALITMLIFLGLFFGSR